MKNNYVHMDKGSEVQIIMDGKVLEVFEEEMEDGGKIIYTKFVDLKEEK